MSGATLAVHLYGTDIARLTRGRSDHRVGWAWTADAAARWGRGARIVSHGVPIGAAGEQLSELRAGVFLDGLLPEGSARLHYAVEAGIDPEDTFALVARYGRDTAGALVIAPAGEATRPDAGPTPLTDDEVGDLLREADGGARPGELTSTSLAGLVPKIGLDRVDGRWVRPAYGAPSTWILKVAHPETADAADVVDTEVLCLDLGRRVGVTTVGARIITPGGVRAIAVARYDRPRTGDPARPVGRLHQEDLAQALGLATADPTRKFQRGRNLPSWRSAADVLASGGGLLSPLARLVTFSYLVGNTDHHAKNTSFLRHPDGRVTLAPGYDIAAHLHHPGRHRSALDLAGESDFATLTIAHVIEEICSWDVPHDRAVAAARDVVDSLTDALRAVDRTAHPGVGPEAWATLADRVATATDQLRSASR